MGKIMHGGISYSGGGGSGGASAMSDLTDVELTNLADGQILKYDSTNQEWVNANESGGGSSGILYGNTDPTSQQGEDGNLYFKYVENKGVSRIFGKVNGDWLAYSMFLEYEWDFTKSLIAINNGTVITLNGGALRSDSGISFSSSGHYANIPADLLQTGYTYEIHISSLSIRTSSNNNRLFMFTDSNTHNAGFVWHGATGKWGVWDSINTWQDSSISDKDYFNNSVLKIKITTDGKWHIYKDDVLIFEPANAITLKNTAFVLGATSNSCYDMTITKFKIYPNVN